MGRAPGLRGALPLEFLGLSPIFCRQRCFSRRAWLAPQPADRVALRSPWCLRRHERGTAGRRGTGFRGPRCGATPSVARDSATQSRPARRVADPGTAPRSPAAPQPPTPAAGTRWGRALGSRSARDGAHRRVRAADRRRSSTRRAGRLPGASPRRRARIAAGLRLQRRARSTRPVHFPTAQLSSSLRSCCARSVE